MHSLSIEKQNYIPTTSANDDDTEFFLALILKLYSEFLALDIG